MIITRRLTSTAELSCSFESSPLEKKCGNMLPICWTLKRLADEIRVWAMYLAWAAETEIRNWKRNTVNPLLIANNYLSYFLHCSLSNWHTKNITLNTFQTLGFNCSHLFINCPFSSCQGSLTASLKRKPPILIHFKQNARLLVNSHVQYCWFIQR